MTTPSRMAVNRHHSVPPCHYSSQTCQYVTNVIGLVEIYRLIGVTRALWRRAIFRCKRHHRARRCHPRRIPLLCPRKLTTRTALHRVQASRSAHNLHHNCRMTTRRSHRSGLTCFSAHLATRRAGCVAFSCTSLSRSS